MAAACRRASSTTISPHYYVYAGDTLTVAGNVGDGTTDYGGSESFTINGGVFTVGGNLRLDRRFDLCLARRPGSNSRRLTEDSFGDGVYLYVPG